MTDVTRRKFPTGVFAEGRNFTLYSHRPAISWQTGLNISSYSNKKKFVANRAVQQREMNLFFSYQQVITLASALCETHY